MGPSANGALQNLPSKEREQTDESLRTERAATDADLAARMAAVDEAADAIVAKARTMADAVLAAARATSDRREDAPSARPLPAVARERARADRLLEDQRASADETLRVEREEQPLLRFPERDETDQDLSRERARSDDSVSARDAFLGVVSHDLRKMLNSMLGFAALVAKDVSRESYDEQVFRYASHIERTGLRMNRLFGDLVDVASIEAGVLGVWREWVDPAEVVREAVDCFRVQADANRVSLEAEIAASLPTVALDPARILQVLTHLLANALKFTPADGKVVVRVEQRRDDVRFSVRDTGPGLPPDKVEAAFHRFGRGLPAAPGGLGLGLYISRAIVQGHGGQIWAGAAPGGGAIVSFTVPRSIT